MNFSSLRDSQPRYCNRKISLLSHSVVAIRLAHSARTLVSDGVDCIDANKDTFSHKEATSIARNIQANITMERQSVQVLLNQLDTSSSALKWHLYPSVVTAVAPGQLVSLAGRVKLLTLHKKETILYVSEIVSRRW